MFLITTLSFGFKRPESGDKGDVFFPALEDNITQVNSHDHDGVDSPKLNPFNLNKARTTVAGSGWTEEPASSGRYSKTVTLPAGYTLDVDATVLIGIPQMSFYLSGGALDGEEVNPTWERIPASDTTFKLFMPTNGQQVIIIYG